MFLSQKVTGNMLQGHKHHLVGNLNGLKSPDYFQYPKAKASFLFPISDWISYRGIIVGGGREGSFSLRDHNIMQLLFLHHSHKKDSLCGHPICICSGITNPVRKIYESSKCSDYYWVKTAVLQKMSNIIWNQQKKRNKRKTKTREIRKWQFSETLDLWSLCGAKQSSLFILLMIHLLYILWLWPCNLIMCLRQYCFFPFLAVHSLLLYLSIWSYNEDTVA